MKRTLLHAVAGAGMAALLLLVGCPSPLGTEREAGSEQEGAIVLVFRDERAKTLVPEISLEITSYEVSFTRTGFQPVVISNLPGDTVQTEPVSLRPGLWTVIATAFNQAANIIGVASAEVLVKARQTSTSSLVIKSLSGDGTLSLSADLSGVELISPTIGGSLTFGASGEVTPISLTISGSSASYTGTLAAGTYLLALELVDEDSSVARYVDTVLIVKDLTTAGSLIFKAVQGSVIVQLADEITRPIEISLSGLKATVGTEESMVVTASPAVVVDSYQWYLDGEELSGQTSSQLTLGPGLGIGEYALAVVVKKGALYSSQGAQFTVVTASIVQVSAGTYHTMLVRSDGTLWATGRNDLGQLGIGDTTDRYSFVRVAEDVVAVSTGGKHTLLVKSDGTLWATGRNDLGQLGTGDTDNRFSFVQVAEQVAAVSAGYAHTMLVKFDRTLWATGANGFGMLGIGGDQENRLNFVQVAEQVAAVSAGYAHTMLVKSDGALWAVGRNEDGQLGTGGTATFQLNFVQVADSASAVSAAYGHTLMLMSGGTLAATGSNDNGQLGTGDTADRWSFVQVAEYVAAVSSINRHTMVVKSDGTLWATGKNYYGQLGTGDTTDRSILTEVADEVVAVSAGGEHTMVVKTSGATLWAAGHNDYGQLGTSDTTDRWEFVQVWP